MGGEDGIAVGGGDLRADPPQAPAHLDGLLEHDLEAEGVPLQQRHAGLRHPERDRAVEIARALLQPDQRERVEDS